MSSSLKLIVLALSGAAAFSPALAPAARPALVRGPVAVHAAKLPRVANFPVMDAAKLPRANPPVMEEAAAPESASTMSFSDEDMTRSWRRGDPTLVRCRSARILRWIAPPRRTTVLTCGGGGGVAF